MAVFLLPPSTCTDVDSVLVKAVTTYPSASDKSSTVQLTVIVVAVLPIPAREEGEAAGAASRDIIIIRHNYWCHLVYCAKGSTIWPAKAIVVHLTLISS